MCSSLTCLSIRSFVELCVAFWYFCTTTVLSLEFFWQAHTCIYDDNDAHCYVQYIVLVLTFICYDMYQETISSTGHFGCEGLCQLHATLALVCTQLPKVLVAEHPVLLIVSCYVTNQRSLPRLYISFFICQFIKLCWIYVVASNVAHPEVASATFNWL